MTDIYSRSDAQSLLENKFVLLIGDSNTRAMYKDLVWLIQNGTLIKKESLQKKLENSFLGDVLVKRSALHKGRNFTENRHFEKNGMKIHFYFTTRCYNEMIENKLLSFKPSGIYPDVIFFSSLIWDITRWGPDGVTQYQANMVKLMDLLKSCLPPETLVIWGTTLPVSSDIRSGGFLIKQIEFMKHTLRFEVMQGNHFASQLVASYGFDVLDLHYHIRMQIKRRCKDGIHYTTAPVRHITNLLLSHIALAWGRSLPGYYISEVVRDDTNDYGFQPNNSKGTTDSINLPLGLNKDAVSPIQSVVQSFPRMEHLMNRKIKRGLRRLDQF